MQKKCGIKKPNMLHLFVLTLSMLLLLASCGTVPQNNSETAPETPKELNFDAQYAYTNVRGSNQEEYAKPKVVLIDSKEQLDDYYRNNKDLFFFEMETGAEQDYRKAGFVSFEEAIAKYDAGWFGSKQLLLVINTQPSSITTFSVSKVNGRPENSVIINVGKTGIAESVQTSHIFIELDREFGADDLIDARVYTPAFLRDMESAATYADEAGKVVLRISDQSYELSGDIAYIYSIFGDDLPLWGTVREGESGGYKTFSYGIKTFVYVRVDGDQVKLSKNADFSGADMLVLTKK